MRILVTGVTGYVGGRLVPRLLDRGHAVRVLSRDRGRVSSRPWADRVEIVEADLIEVGSLDGVFRGVDAAFYLVHSMGSGSDFARRDRRAARNFVSAARGIGRVVYLGGLLPEDEEASEHLRSRAEVGEILREGLPTLELRAGPVIGSGSASFEMVRYLTERLPVMIAPKWVENTIQPIAIRDVLSYLVEALERDATGVVEIGADRLTFRRMMESYAEVRGLRRRIVPVPVLAPGLAALWVGFVTPIPNRLAVPLVEGILADLVADTERARALFPGIDPIDYRTAVELALRQIEAHDVRTRWTGALGAMPDFELEWREGMVLEERTRLVEAPPPAVFRAFSGLGGERGWPALRWAWTLRGVLDQLVGGPGLRRGRRDPGELDIGEALDFWRVEAVDPPRLLRLRAEMRLPGRAWLQWENEPGDGKNTLLRQTAVFAPRGLTGTLYWYALYPFHRPIFARLIRAIARKSETMDPFAGAE
ncbi:MAG: SDR family oxidoreductase [Gemmatimonadota bacterium]|nr:SDR family oxidoreductase [Gemmatimonadota bacterium]